MLVVGIDPGTRRLGWGIVALEGTRLKHVAHGIIAPPASKPLGERLVVIETELSAVVRDHTPDAASIEGLFFAKDAQAAAKLGHARGVAMLVCARSGLPIFEYPPARVKRTVAGGGRAAKDQVAKMVKVFLNLGAQPPADAADALAIALTHLQNGAHRASARVAPNRPPIRPTSRR